MIHRHSEGILLPFVSEEIVHLVTNVVQNYASELKMNWMTFLLTMDWPLHIKQSLQTIYYSTIDEFIHVATDTQNFIQKLSTPLHTLQIYHFENDLIFLFSKLNESICAAIWTEKFNHNQTEEALRWIQSLCANLTGTALEYVYKPIFAQSKNAHRRNTRPLSRILNTLAISSNIESAFLFENAPSVRIVDYAVHDLKTHGFVDADLLKIQVLPYMDTSNHTNIPINETLTLSLVHDQSLRAMRSVEAIHASLMLFEEFNTYLHWHGNISEPFHFQNLLLKLDESFFNARTLQDIFDAITGCIFELGKFKRCALFLYNPMTRTFEGVYGRNLDIQDVLRIRESERNLPLLQKIIQTQGSIFYTDVAGALPDYYIERFRLTSLLICPLWKEGHKPFGVLLVDHAGKRFSIDHATISQIDTILTRATKVISSQMYQQTDVPSSLFNPPQHKLTPREKSILQHLAEGMDTKQVAKCLFISEYTVSEHISTILRKLKAKNRTQAVTFALRNHIIH